jgi:hypothetical protein
LPGEPECNEGYYGTPVKPKPTHPELDLGEGRLLVLDGEVGPDDWPVFSNN